MMSTGALAVDPAGVALPASPSPLLRTLRHAALLALEAVALLALVLLFFVRVPQVAGRSMEPQLRSGEHVLINTLSYGLHLGGADPFVDLQFRAVQRGDVVAFVHAGSEGSQVYVKRVVGLPGETIAIAAGTVFINGQALNEPYLSIRDVASAPARSVPRGSYFMLGDNRGDSDDSRVFGPVPRTAIIGRAALVVWPLNRAAPIR